jgi:3-oxoacyl-[acyl-carrier protein] reductase
MARDFSSKVVLVTGGSSGIGAAIARRFARAGAKVTISYSSNSKGADQLVNAVTVKVYSIAARQADHDDPEAAAAFVESTVRKEGRVDILINNAAVGKPALLKDVTTATAERQFRIEVIAPRMAIRAAAPHLAASGGCVVSVSSINAQKPVLGGSVYCATKAALEALTKSFACELGPSGVRVNAVAPGPTEIPILARPLPLEQRAAVMAHTPLGRIGDPEDIAATVTFLAGPGAAWRTGAVLPCSGGLS